MLQNLQDQIDGINDLNTFNKKDDKIVNFI